MKILFVFPTITDENDMPIKFRQSIMPPLTLAVLDSLTPKAHSVELVDDMMDEIDFSRDYDLVGITAMTFQAKRGYQIADKFRSKGVKVIIGGVHASAMPDEALKHADSVVIGEVENLWEEILDDCENNNLKQFYQDDSFPDLKDSVLPKWDNFNMKNYLNLGGAAYIPAFTSRGCPMGCKFCAVTKFLGKVYRIKPVSKVLEEIEHSGAKYFSFCDDNITFRPDYARELFTALRKKDIKWAGQFGIKTLKHPDLIELAGKSGCMDILVGFESINPESLKSVNKSFNKIEQYEELISLMHKAGISVMASFIIGFDEDSPDQLDLTLEFLKKNNVTETLVSILTPLPGTKLFDEMEEQGRIFDYNWSRYTGYHLLFKSEKFTEPQLYALCRDFHKKFYSYKNIISNSWNVATKMRTKKPVSEFFTSLLYLYLYRKYTCSGVEIWGAK